MKLKIYLILMMLINIVFVNRICASSLQTKTETRQLGSFNSIQIDGGYEIVLVQGNEESVTIEAGDERISKLKTSVQDGKLKIYTDWEYNLSNAKITIRFKNIDFLELNGGISISNENVLKLKSIKLNISGGADIKMNLDVESVEAELSGGTNIKLIGNAQICDFRLNGAGNIDAEKLVANKVKVQIAGAGYAEVYAKDEIDASIAGVGSINYSGNPAKVRSNIAGVGIIQEKK